MNIFLYQNFIFATLYLQAFKVKIKHVDGNSAVDIISVNLFIVMADLCWKGLQYWTVRTVDTLAKLSLCRAEGEEATST